MNNLWQHNQGTSEKLHPPGSCHLRFPTRAPLSARVGALASVPPLGSRSFSEVPQLIQFIQRWDHLLSIGAVILLYVIAFIAVGHILLNKREPRAALGWIVVCLGFPGLGVLAYILFGVNRIQSRAKFWQTKDEWGLHPQNHSKRDRAIFERNAKHHIAHDTFYFLTNISESVSRRPLVDGCRIEILHNGEELFPEMLKAIETAKRSVYLCTYIFENNESGRAIADALGRAHKRGVDVKVIIDGIGIYYSIPTIMHRLKKHGVRIVRFLPPSISKRSIHLNLRNHRKLLIIDRKIGFTGGMNIGDRHCLTKGKKMTSQVCDFHFKVQGPVVGQFEDAFFEDWFFVTKERPPELDVSEPDIVGEALCRGITAGPNEDFEKLKHIINGAISCAKKHIRIMTPYFIPDPDMISALVIARLKGIDVEIILPQANNIPFVGWASQAYLEDFLRNDIKIYYRPKPFAHSKVLVIDDFFLLVGSANLDPRSLRLNFEFNLEVYDKDFTLKVIDHFEEVKEKSYPVTVEMMQKRHLAIKLRDALCKIFSPYL